jgi:ATPase subunit of ABC transporter with duplicated ATPase domains
MKQILALSHARKSYDGKVVLNDVTLGFLPGAKIGVVGPNGMGKSTLLRMILGEEQPDVGSIRVGETVRIFYTDQMRAGIDPGKTVWEVISGGEAYFRAGGPRSPAAPTWRRSGSGARTSRSRPG